MTKNKWQRQVADGTVVVLRPLAALLHQHQLIPHSDALLASPDALSQSSLFLTVRILGQLALAGSADLHARRDEQDESRSDEVYVPYCGVSSGE